MRRGRSGRRFKAVTIHYRWAHASDYKELGDVMFDAVRGRSPAFTPKCKERHGSKRRGKGSEWDERLTGQSIAVAELGKQNCRLHEP